MPFFENIPAYRPPVHVVTQPARKVPTLEELGIRVIENVKTSIILAGLLAKDKVTVKDTGCGAFVGTGKLASWVTNELSVDKLLAQDEDCAETFEGTILQGMLAAGHAEAPVQQTDNTKAGQRQGVNSSGDGSPASNASKRSGGGVPWWCWLLVAVAGAVGWEWLSSQVPRGWLRWRARLE